MTKSEFFDYVKMLQASYKKPYPQPGLAPAFAQLADLPCDIMPPVIDAITLQHTTLPPLQKLVDLALQEYRRRQERQTADREHEAAEDKEQYRRGQAKAFAENTGVARDSLLLIRAILARKTTRGQTLEGVRHLDQLYPRAGFATEGGKLSRFYQGRGADLEEVAGTWWKTSIRRDDEADRPSNAGAEPQDR